MDDARKREPFFMMPKPALDTIIRGVDGTDAAFCVAVFTALRWLANDGRRANGPVEVTVAQIARRAGVSYNTSAKALGILKSLGVVLVSERNVPGTHARAPSLYGFPTMWGRFPTATPPRRAESIKERKESKESLAPAGAVALEGSLSPTPPAPTPAPATRPRNALFDALTAADGSDPRELTQSAARACGVALAEIKKASPDVTVAEIQRRASNYHLHYPDCAITPNALAHHWAKCGNPPSPSTHATHQQPTSGRTFSQAGDYSKAGF